MYRFASFVYHWTQNQHLPLKSNYGLTNIDEPRVDRKPKAHHFCHSFFLFLPICQHVYLFWCDMHSTQCKCCWNRTNSKQWRWTHLLVISKEPIKPDFISHWECVCTGFHFLWVFFSQHKTTESCEWMCYFRFDHDIALMRLHIYICNFCCQNILSMLQIR